MTKKILIIDDDKIFSKVLRDSLNASNGEDCVVFNTYNGEEGLEVARKEKPNLIISDIMMPKMNGIEFIKKIKQEEDLRNTPILISTQVPDMNKISEAIEVGVNGYIIKSEHSLEGIVKQVSEILEGK